MEERDDDIERIRREHYAYLVEAAREKGYINEAHRLLDVLLFSKSTENRLVDLHNFLNQIALIEDFEIQNQNTNDARALYALAIRASDFAMEEYLRQDINREFASAIKDFLDEFETFVNDIKSSKGWTYDSVIEEENKGVRRPYYTAGYRFKNVPTKPYVDALKQKGNQAQPVKGMESQQTMQTLTVQQQQELLELVAREPDKFLKLVREVFYDVEFVAQLRKTAIGNFPRAYKEHFKKPFKIISKAEIEEETQKFAEAVDRKIQRMNREISDGGKY